MKYLIIGGTGSLGKKLIDRLSKGGHELFVYSRDESKHWTLLQELKVASPQLVRHVHFIVGDIRDYARLLDVMNTRTPDVVIIAAALKQVDTCEASPSESVATNLTGTQNVIAAVNNAHWHPKKVLFVSTDKASGPCNVYGMCKSLSERLITSQVHNSVATNAGTRWLCTRYGNVLESRGSIIPLFKYQSQNALRLTVTDPEMTRFLMTLDESVDLIQTTLNNAENGETWIPILPSMKIGDLASIFSEMSGKPVEITGVRPGEKKHEDLITEPESSRVVTRDSKHYIIKHALYAGSDKNSTIVASPFKYSSDQSVLSKNSLHAKLMLLGLLDASLNSFVGRSIEEIRKD